MEELVDLDKMKIRNYSNKEKSQLNVNEINNSIKLMLPRDVQNAKSLIFSQINLNKYSWEDQGDKVKIANN